MSVCAVVVTYQPDKELVENITQLIEQVDEIIIVDNGSADASQKIINSLRRMPKISVIFNDDNMGVAVALNIGVRKAKSDGYQWVVTFDQDSQVTPGMITTMLETYNAYPKKEKIASLSPRYRNNQSKQIINSPLLSPSNKNKTFAEARYVLTSGNLVKLSIFDHVGYFNEDLFIDFVDTEFCLRCRYQGLKIIEVKSAILLHKIGLPEHHRFLWRGIKASNHSPLRRYYIARNAIYTFNEFIFKRPKWSISIIVFLTKVVLIVAFYENHRKEKLSAIIMGVVDGVLGRMGKCKRLIPG